MSHEIRTPISSIMGFLELLSGSGLSKEQRVEAISLAYATGQSLLGLIGEILDVDKIESGNYQLQPQWVLSLLYHPEHLSLFRCDCCKQIDRIKLQQYVP